ncbi:MAG: hypothetical protein K2W96_26845, partial [Gemmataceae bacterium]|nr:hypothetical protein [Gemmataceae bacterium]
MHRPLRELLAGLIDYAGLFPPAKLPLADALRLWREYAAGPDAWMLGRFVIQASRLHEIEYEGSLPIAALGRGGNDEASFVQGLKDDLADIERCRARLPGVVIDTLETKPPPGLVPDLSACRGLR